MDVYARLEELGVKLPSPAPKVGIYKPVIQIDDMLYISGQGATIDGVPAITGRIGEERTIEEGQEAAKLCALNALAALHEYLGDLNKIDCIVKTLGFVASAADFYEQPKVINGCSALIRDIWGEDKGIGARSAIATNVLPGNISAEIEFVFKLK